ncbi:MAG: SDR family oxidoreductase [Nitriliruptoraceae bacterium]|nr:SDR family oxidoreductase [Nitriliruptoraceae bacterium]
MSDTATSSADRPSPGSGPSTTASGASIDHGGRPTPRGTVVVTGAAGGIGRAIVDELVARGQQVLGVDLADGIVDALAPVEGARGLRADLGDDEGRADVLEVLGDEVCAGLVNCAGITRDGLLRDLDDETIALVLEVNAVAGAALAELLAPRIADGGAIVNIASRAALGNVGQVNYATSKGMLIGLTRALAHQLAPRVRVNAVAPGLIATEMTAAMPEKVLAKLTARVPMDRMGLPAEIAVAVADLLGPDTSYITGQTVFVCGGRSI